MPAPNPDSFILCPSEMVNIIEKAFQRVLGHTRSHEQPLLCKFCGKRVRDASYAPNGSVINGPMSEMAHYPESGVTVIWHKSCHRVERAGTRKVRSSQANNGSDMELEGDALLLITNLCFCNVFFL